MKNTPLNMKLKTIMALFFLTLFAEKTFAFSRLDFLGVQTLVSITSQDASGATDEDAYNLFRHMNVEVQNSFLGPGKSIATKDQTLNFICANRNGAYQCAIFVKTKSDFVRVDPSRKSMSFKMSGAAAEEIRQLWELTDREYHFVSTDNVFKVDVAPNSFKLEYNGSNLEVQSDYSVLPL